VNQLRLTSVSVSLILAVFASMGISARAGTTTPFVVTAIFVATVICLFIWRAPDHW
jgi:hypothetical protein